MSKQQKWMFLFLLVSIVIAGYISIQVAYKSTFAIDKTIAGWLSGTPSGFIPFFKEITEMGDKIGIGIVALLMVVWLLIFRKNYVGAAAFALALAIGNEASKLLKDTFARPRPSLEHLVPVSSYSYPSGHSMVGMITYFFIAYLILEAVRSKNGKVIVGVIAGILLLLIGASRIILQVHYPTDVIGGFAFGYIWVTIWIFIYQFSKRKLKKG
jgi:membrane-associated phospholipid phosphatase